MNTYRSLVRCLAYSMLVVAILPFVNCSMITADISEKCRSDWCIEIHVRQQLAGYNFIVKSENSKENTSEILFAYSQDEPLSDNEINRRMHFISDEIGFVWLGFTFGVSKDGGKSWKMTNFKEESNFGRNEALMDISFVRISDDGIGKIEFNQNEYVQKQPFFTTKDFGATWEEHSEP